MNKPTRTILIIIGFLSILTGVYSYFYKHDSSNTYFAIFIGMVLIGSVFLTGNKKKDEK